MTSQRPKIDRLTAEQRDLCAYCQEPFGRFEDEANATLDHVVPLSRGGKNVAANLVAACARCNNAKGDLNAAEFCARIDAGKLRKRRNIVAIQAGRRRARAIFSPNHPKVRGTPQIVPKGSTKAGPTNPPHSKNKPAKRLYTMEEARQWDEDRFAS